MSEKITAPAITNQVKTLSRRSVDIPTGLLTVASDLDNIYKYLSSHKGAFESTYTDGLTVSPFSKGLSGSTLLVGEGILNGALFNDSANRPKTIEEVMVGILNAIDVSLATEDASSQILSVKNKMGLNLFDEGLQSEDASLDRRIDLFNMQLAQIAADCFNRNSRIGEAQDVSVYGLNGEGNQSQEYSLRDLIDLLVGQHGGIHSLGHEDLGQKMYLPTIFDSSEGLLDGGSTVYTCPGTNKYGTFSEAAKFYNPSRNRMEIQRLFINIDQNTLVDNTTVTVYVDGNPTDMQLHVAGGALGSSFYDEEVILVNPGSFVQFRVTPGEVSTGLLHVSNIVITTQEKNL